jgi:hypothetical protein
VVAIIFGEKECICIFCERVFLAGGLSLDINGPPDGSTDDQHAAYQQIAEHRSCWIIAGYFLVAKRAATGCDQEKFLSFLYSSNFAKNRLMSFFCR